MATKTSPSLTEFFPAYMRGRSPVELQRERLAMDSLRSHLSAALWKKLTAAAEENQRSVTEELHDRLRSSFR